MSDTLSAPAPAPRIGGFAYVLGGLSFIPLLGVPAGVAALIWGLVTRRAGGRIVAGMGAAGVLLTVLLYGSLFYFGFVQRGGLYDNLRASLAQENLNSTVKEIEFYRISNGKYPDDLEELKGASKTGLTAATILDPRMDGGSMTPKPFYYKKLDADHYLLRGVGADGQPFSPGSLGPQVPENAKLGLVASPPSL